MTRFPFVLLAALAALPLPAQVRGFAQGAGMARSLTFGTECFLDTAVLAPIGPATTWSAGGAAIDRRRSSLWISNGTELEERALGSYLVLTSAMPVTPRIKYGHVSGLAYDILRNELIQLETRDGSAALVTHAIQAGGGLVYARMQQFTLPEVDMRATGVAFDGARRRLWVASRRQGLYIPYSALHLSVFAQMHSGTWLHQCTRAITSAGHAPVDALMYDEQSDTLHAATSTRMLHLAPDPDTCGDVDVVFECALFHDDGHALRGFDLERAHAVPVSAGCASRGCSPCPSFLDPAGQAVVGNDAFALALTQSQSGGLATLWARFGPAATEPFACGTTYTPAATSVAVAVGIPVTGGMPCTGTATLPCPLPADYSLCGTDLYVQAVIVCPGGALALSNATRIFLDSD